jgi:hypothetical protein
MLPHMRREANDILIVLFIHKPKKQNFPKIGHVVIPIVYRAPRSLHASHQHCTIPYVDCQAFVIGIPLEMVHLRLKTLLTSANDCQVIKQEQMRDTPGPRLATLYMLPRHAHTPC